MERQHVICLTTPDVAAQSTDDDRQSARRGGVIDAAEMSRGDAP